MGDKAEKQLVVLEDIERDLTRMTGYGRTLSGRKVEFPVDETMLVGIVRILMLRDGASVWVPSKVLRGQSTAARDRVDAQPPVGHSPDHLAANRVPHDRRAVVFMPEPFVASLVAGILAADRYDTSLVTDPARILAGSTPPDVVVLDLIHPAAPNGIAVAEGIASAAPTVGIVFLTRLPDARFVGAELPGGKRTAFLRLEAMPDHTRLLEAADAVVDKRSSRVFRDDLAPDRPLGELSNRQLWLLSRLAQGHLLSEIAASRGVSERGAQRLLSRTYLRLGIAVRTSGHARSLAVRRFFDAAGVVPVAGIEDGG